MVKCMASKKAKACDISPKVRKEVMKRDGGCCIICGSAYGLQIAHYISRGRLGLGVPENLGVMCLICHQKYDQSKFHKDIGKLFRAHLQEHYPNWDERKLIYSKWSDFNGNTR